ncbi:aspartate/glutamate racemase family protein [Rhodobacter sp. NSM]|uniref:aspartate/glutamate racemase family protein n=1 Tax=Rhodobacter sp. NSM TaxID=3457501 RepID=UPI003FD48200
MKLLYINPNSTASMTEAVVRIAREAASGLEIIGWTNEDGPPAIQGPEDGAAAVAGIRKLLPAARDAGVDAIVLACFDDTGLAEIRAAAHCPVIGIGQAAFHLAALLGHRFSVVTTLPVSVPVIEENLSAYGLAGQCARVRASGLAVLEVEAAEAPALARLAEEIAQAEAEDGIAAAILGCAGMAPLARALSAGTRLRLIDGVAAAAHLAPALVRASRSSERA